MSRGQEGHAGTEGVVETPYDVVYAGICGEVQLDDESCEEVTVAVLSSIESSGYVIAPAADVITPDQRARLRHLIRYFDGYKAPEQIGIAAWEIRDTLVALATGGTDGQ